MSWEHTLNTIVPIILDESLGVDSKRQDARGHARLVSISVESIGLLELPGRAN